jgi:hypothetical protein
MRGKRPELVNAAVRSALRETVFRFELIVRVNVTVGELLERECLIDAALAAEIALRSWEASRDARFGERLGKLRDLLVFQVGEIRAAQEARDCREPLSRWPGGTLARRRGSLG